MKKKKSLKLATYLFDNDSNKLKRLFFKRSIREFDNKPAIQYDGKFYSVSPMYEEAKLIGVQFKLNNLLGTSKGSGKTNAHITLERAKQILALEKQNEEKICDKNQPQGSDVHYKKEQSIDKRQRRMIFQSQKKYLPISLFQKFNMKMKDSILNNSIEFYTKVSMFLSSVKIGLLREPTGMLMFLLIMIALI